MSLTKLLDFVPLHGTPPHPSNVYTDLGLQVVSPGPTSSPNGIMKPYIWDTTFHLPVDSTDNAQMAKDANIVVRIVDDQTFAYRATIVRGGVNEEEEKELQPSTLNFIQQVSHPLYDISMTECVDIVGADISPLIISLSMDSAYRSTIVCRRDHHDQLHDILSTIVRMTMDQVETDATRRKRVLLLGYTVKAHTTKFKHWKLLPSMPFCATHCDVNVPRKGKRDRLKITKRRFSAHVEEIKKHMSHMDADTSELFLNSSYSPSILELLEQTGSTPIHPSIVKQLVLEQSVEYLQQKAASSAAAATPPPTTTAQEEKPCYACPKKRARAFVKLMKRRDYATVYDGGTSAVLFAKTFYRSLCKLMVNGKFRQEESLPSSNFTEPLDYTIYGFIRSGGFDEIHVTLPRMHRSGLNSIANVMLNFFMELPAQKIYFDYRLLEHCSLQELLTYWIGYQSRERIESLFLMGNVCTYTALFPLLHLNPSMTNFPLVYLSCQANGNEPLDITHVFHEHWAPYLENFSARQPQKQIK